MRLLAVNAATAVNAANAATAAKAATAATAATAASQTRQVGGNRQVRQTGQTSVGCFGGGRGEAEGSVSEWDCLLPLARRRNNNFVVAFDGN